MGNHIGTAGFPAIEDAASGGEVQERFRGTGLKPCPFDRETCDPDCLEIVVEPDTEARPDVLHGYVTCHDCGARGPEAWADEANIRATAAFGWNDRTTLKARGD